MSEAILLIRLGVARERVLEACRVWYRSSANVEAPLAEAVRELMQVEAELTTCRLSLDRKVEGS